MNKISKRKIKGFTLIELMVVLAIITIIATASVPQVQMWTARNRGNQVASQIITDFSKAKSIARNMVKQQAAVVAGSYVFGSRPQVAIYFKEDAYHILQRNDMSLSGWSETSDGVIKSFQLPKNIVLYSVNGEQVSSGKSLMFSSTGRLKSGDDGSFVSPVNNKTYIKVCGAESSTLDETSVFMVVFKVRVSSKDLWYRVEMAPSGEYFACVSGTSSFNDSISNVLEL